VAAISSELGLVHAKFPPPATSLDSRIYCDFIDELVAKVGYPLTIFTDNLSAHDSQYTREYLFVTHPQVGHIFNVPYRPDLNGIELYWLPLKTEYRKRVCNYKANSAGFNNSDLVQELFVNQERNKPEFAKKCAADGW
jgi:transposase